MNAFLLHFLKLFLAYGALVFPYRKRFPKCPRSVCCFFGTYHDSMKYYPKIEKHNYLLTAKLARKRKNSARNTNVSAII